MCTRTGIEHVYWGDQGLAWQGMAERSECCGINAGLSVTLMIQMREVHQNWDERCVTELRSEVCTKTGIKHEYQNWD